MGWEIDNRGNSRYVQKRRVDGKVTSKYFTGEAANVAAQADLDRRAAEAERKAHHRKQEEMAVLADKTLHEIVAQWHMNEGFVRRHYRWQLIDNLHKPLTPEEIAKSEHVKSTSVPYEPPALEFSRSPTPDL